ncbi:glycine/D-amino acid oxidase [Gemmobacter tilapiae]|uniref:Glycine/D-amino acid oxidase n=2 Tax=Neogemmobacter tilapiae TaxID=875041 RepID=A0A918TEI9_9RHOB|nr:glycine/D-amino acid oxidase [Gemmobacter tilapiae]
MQDVVIAGGGVMGSAAAWWLAKIHPGITVTVVEPDPSYAKAATALSVASIRSQFSTAVNVQISRFGVDFIRNFTEHLGPGAGDLGLRENGYLFVTSNPDNVALMRELAEMQRSHGAATQILSADELRAKYPWMNCDDLAAGSFGPRDEGWFDNMGLLGGFKAAARAMGVRYVTDRVVGVQVAGGRVQGMTLEKGGDLPCGALVNAAGTGATAIMALAGLAHPVEPRKRTVFVIDAPNARHPEAPLLIDQGFYLRPEGPHWITATVPADDQACDINDFDPDLHLFEEVIWEQLYHRAPGFDAVKVIRHWVGHYDYNTLDQNAIVGPHPELPNLYLMSGFSGHGLQQSPALGRGIAEHILTGGWQTLDLSDLGVERVLAGRAFRERAVV